MSSKFVHLHTHTEYSLLDGLSKISGMLEHVKELGMNEIAVTDHGVMYGAIEFYKKAKKAGVKPIIGMEGYITKGSLKQRGENGKTKNHHLLLLAKDLEGYKNLMKLTSIAHLEGYYYRPRFDHEMLAKHSKGLVCTSSCIQGEVPQALLEDDYKKAKKIAKWHLDVFGKDYYLEVQNHQFENFIQKAENAEIKRELTNQAQEFKKYNEGIVKLSREMGIPLVATNDAHYIKKEDATAQDALVCISTGKNVSDTKRLRFVDTPSFYLKSPQEMSDLFPELPDAIENTVKIAKKCNLEIALGEFFFPKIKIPKNVTPEKFLTKKAREGLKAKFKKVTKEYKERLEYELKVINEKKYATYFIIFWDMAKWTKVRGIPINIRGSVAGSLVTYVLGITTVDPIYYGLPFERFLNPQRPSAPDIDLDIADDKREELIAYLVDKYGQEKVAQICTFGRMLARGSVRDVARVLGYDYAIGDKISKSIPMGVQGFPMTIDRALKESKELKQMYDSDTDAKKVIDLAKQLEGNARHISVHAAGVVISPTELVNFTPLQREPSGEKVITQYEMWSCEDVGLVKLDILGIRNLSILREAVSLVKETSNKEVDLFDIPLDEKKTFEMLSRGETMGVFQLSGSGMTRYLVDLKPEKIEDIMMMIALFRPGPMKNIDEYIARKHGKKKVEYYHPKMEKFLDKSLGVLVYQDDLLYTALELAGYDWLEVDKFRKAVGKKIPEEMARQHERFVKGCQKYSDMSKKEAEGLWDLFEPFQGYGFNKAHSASYGMVAYWTAFMKANYPVEFMTALLTAESGDTEKISQGVNECRRMGIKVMPPDINESGVRFNVVKNEESHEGKGIRFGLSAIKNVGVAAIEAILEERDKGDFESFADFLGRVDGRRVNKRVLESLIKVGALSRFGNRAALLSSMDEIRGKVSKSNLNSAQQGLFSQEELSSSAPVALVQDIPEFSEDELQSLERQLMGFSLSAKPISERISSLGEFATHTMNEVSADEVVNQIVRVAGVVSEVRVIVTKKTGAQMAFVKMKDDTGTVDLVVFPNIFEETKQHLVDDTPLLITGKVDVREDATSLIANTIDTVEGVKEKGGQILGAQPVYVRIPEATSRESLGKLKELLLKHPGESQVILVFEAVGNSPAKKVPTKVKIAWSKNLANLISSLLEGSPVEGVQ